MFPGGLERNQWQKMVWLLTRKSEEIQQFSAIWASIKTKPFDININTKYFKSVNQVYWNQITVLAKRQLFYGWGSTVSTLQSHYQETVYFLPLTKVTEFKQNNKTWLASFLGPRIHLLLVYKTWRWNINSWALRFRWTSAIRVTRMRHECDTSETKATRVRHECYTNDTSATRVNKFWFW